MSLPSDVTVDNLKDFYAMILPYLNVGNGGTSDTPLGQVAFFDDVVAPAGWLIADGTVYNIADYPDLATQYERVHGSKNFYGGNGTTTFAVPDLQGEFLRASGTNGHANQGSGAAVGVHQDATIHMGITSQDSANLIWANGYDDAQKNADSEINISNRKYNGGTAQTGYTNPTNYTSRPTNTSLLCCIKAVPSSDIYTDSYAERRVGTYVDGKPKYQRCVDITLPNVTSRTWENSLVDLTDWSIDTMVSITGNGHNTVGQYLCLPYNDTVMFMDFNYDPVNKKLRSCYNSANNGIFTGTVAICYTKTTD